MSGSIPPVGPPSTPVISTKVTPAIRALNALPQPAAVAGNANLFASALAQAQGMLPKSDSASNQQNTSVGNAAKPQAFLPASAGMPAGGAATSTSAKSGSPKKGRKRKTAAASSKPLK